MKQRKKRQQELREVDRLSFVSKEMQESLKESLQHQLQEVEKRRNDLMPEHQKAQKRTQKIQSLQDKRRNLQKESLAAWKEGRFRLLSDKVGTNRMADAEAQLQGLQAGEEGRSSNSSQAVDCCWETMVEQVFAVGTDQARSTFDALCQIFFRGFETFHPSRANAKRRRGKKRQWK